MKVRSFHTRIWTDSYFLSLSPQEKLLFLYYIFNERVNIIFCYECPDDVVRFETGINKDIVEKGMVKFLS